MFRPSGFARRDEAVAVGRARDQWRFGAQLLPPLVLVGEDRPGHVVFGLIDGRPVVLVCCTGGSGVHVWDLTDHGELGTVIRPRGGVNGVAYGNLRGRPVAVLVGLLDRRLRVWDLAESRQIRSGKASRGPQSVVRGSLPPLNVVTCTVSDERLLAVTGGYDGSVRIWDVARARQLGAPLRGHTQPVRAVACGLLDDRPIAVTGGDDKTVRVWDLRRREPVGPPRRGHTNQVWALACGMLDGRPIAVSGGWDRTVRLWDLDEPDAPGRTLRGHGSDVMGVALTAVSGQTVAVSAGDDVRVWDLHAGRQIGPPLFDGRDFPRVQSLACCTLNGRPVALALASVEPHVRLWDLAEHRRLPTRHVTELPTDWTDPHTGDVVDLTADLVDRDGEHWELVDHDGIEPIVGRVRPVAWDWYRNYGLEVARAKYGVRHEPSRGPYSRHRQRYEFHVVDRDRLLSSRQRVHLALRWPDSFITGTKLIREFRADDRIPDPGRLLGPVERDMALCEHFDAVLEIQAGVERTLVFRLPTIRLDPEILQPYLLGPRDDDVGLTMRVRGSDLLLSFVHTDNEQPTPDQGQPSISLTTLLPLRADLARGDLSAAYIGWLRAVQELDDRNTRPLPPRPTELREMTPRLTTLARLLNLNGWGRSHLP
jgi:WD40 repeat protein